MMTIRRALTTSVATLLLAAGTAAPALAAPDLTGGANQPGVYHPTDSVESPNGTVRHENNGRHRAVGRPMTGSVGNADAKNPAGQLPSGPGDENSGYECDGNNGVGVGNPAHTTCVSTGS